ARLLSLSAELHLQIFKYLDPVHATCLGLVSKNLYAIYSAIHSKIPLNSFTYECLVPQGPYTSYCYLYKHLREWKPADLSYC
ncbi:hypothetical protein B0J14DRAFT_455099, partial [Halenospora varia]